MYSTTSAATASDWLVVKIRFEIHVYICADKLDITGLKGISCQRIVKYLFQSGYDCGWLHEILELVLESTSPRDQDPRFEMLRHYQVLHCLEASDRRIADLMEKHEPFWWRMACKHEDCIQSEWSRKTRLERKIGSAEERTTSKRQGNSFMTRSKRFTTTTASRRARSKD